jgi:4-amino-4-deoxy-L-arabinose transferase-like glycosyltransferase
VPALPCSVPYSTTRAQARVQLLHWCACVAAVIIAYALIHNGRLNNADAGLVILLLLSLTVFLDGAHVGRHVYMLGILLGLTTLVMAYFEEFIWSILIISVCMTLIAIYWDRYHARRG